MTLRELGATFERITGDKTWKIVESIAEADGVLFMCPKCFKENCGEIGTHYVMCWRPRVDQRHFPNPGRWEFQGTGLDDLTLVAGSSSVKLTSGCKAHFFVRNGQIEAA